MIDLARLAMFRYAPDVLVIEILARRMRRRALRAAITKPETLLVRRFLNHGDVAVDVGANGGDWTLAMSNQVGRTGRVFAFEADPLYARATRRTLALLRIANVKFFDAGLSDTRGEAELIIQDASGRRLAGTSHIGATSGSRAVAVRLERLDDLAAHYGEIRSARLIKCDVEGHEEKVFLGAAATIRAAKPVVVCEVGGPGRPVATGYSRELFSGLGYSVFGIEIGTDTLVKLGWDHTLPSSCGSDVVYAVVGGSR